MKYGELKCNQLDCHNCPFRHNPKVGDNMIMLDIRDYLCIAGRRDDTLREHIDKFQLEHPKYKGDLMVWIKRLNKTVDKNMKLEDNE